MSNVIDDRVVSLRFDNKNFESNVATSMNTLDKLKNKLKFSKSTRAFEDINSAANKVNLSGLSSGVDTLHARFSALQVVGVTALTNITNSAINAGKRITKALTIDPIKTGFSEYETKINSVQTIMSNTASKGTTMAEVTKTLDELNTYADKTIYNFAEMTRNIGTFTAAGVDLHKATKAIQGIANLAAASGSNSQQASSAMYQLSQALASGTIRLMDWNSVVNAGMGGEKFQNALKQTAREHGVAVDAIIAKQGSFRESLSKEWLSAEIMNDTLNKFTVDGAKKYSQAMMDAGKYTREQADALVKEAQSMEDAATKVKTFTQLWSTLQETAQSGWAKTWELIFGDFENARTLFSDIFDTLGPIIDKMSDARNTLVENVLGSNWNRLAKHVKNAKVDVDKFQKELIDTGKKHKKVTDEMITSAGSFEKSLRSGWLTSDLVIETLDRMANSSNKVLDSQEKLNNKLKKFQKVVDDVWSGEFKNGPERMDALTKAGYDYAEVQELVNKTINGRRLTLDDLSESQLKAVGYTSDEIKAIKSLAKEARDANTPLNDLINKLSKPTGKELLFGSFKNIFDAIKKPVEAIAKAWEKIFPEDEKEKNLYNLIEQFNELTKSMIISDKTANSLKTVFEGLFAGFKLGTSIVSMSVIGGLKILNAVLQLLGLNLLDLAEIIATYIIKVAEWVEKNTFLIGTFDKIGTVLASVIIGITNLIEELKKLDIVKDVITAVSNAINKFFGLFDVSSFNGTGMETIIKIIDQFFIKLNKHVSNFNGSKMSELLRNMFSGFKQNIENALSTLQQINLVEIGKNVVEGFKIGLEEGASDLWNGMVNIATKLIEAAKNVLGIQSPSTVFMAIGGFIISGLILGIHKNISGLEEVVDFVADVLKNIFSDVDFTDVALVGSIGILAFLVNKLIGVLKTFAGIADGIGGILNSVKAIFNSFSDWIDAKTLQVKARAIKTIAEAIAILVGALVALTLVDHGKLFNSILALGAVAGILVALVFISKNIDDIEGFGKLSMLMLSFGASLALMAIAAKTLSAIDPERLTPTMVAFAGLIGAMGAVMLAFGYISKGDLLGNATKNATRLGNMFVKLSFAMVLMVGVIKLISLLSEDEIKRGAFVIAGMGALFAALSFVSGFSGKSASKAGKMFIKMSVAIGLMVGVMKLIGLLTVGEIAKGIYVIQSISGIFAIFAGLSSFTDENKISKIGNMCLKIGVAVGIIAFAIGLIASLSVPQIIKGISVVIACGALFYALGVLSSTLCYGQGDSISKASNMFIKIGIAIGFLAIAIKMIAGLTPGEVFKGLAVVTACMLLFKGVTKISKYAGEHGDKAGTLILKMSIAIGALAIVVRLLRGLSYADVTKGLLFMSGVGLIFSAIILVSHFAGQHADKAGAMLMKMAVPIAVLAASIALLSFLDPERLAVATVCMSTLIGMFSLLVAATTQVQKATGTLVLLSIIVAEIASILFIMQGLPIKSTLVNATALSMLLMSMSVFLKILGSTTYIFTSAIKGALMMTAIMAVVAIVLGVMSAFKIEASLETANAISTLLIAVATSALILSWIGPMGIAAATGAVAILKVIGIVAGIITILATIISKLDTDFLIDGLEKLSEISFKIGEVIGSFAGGMLSGMASGLPEIGTKLSKFMTNAQGFIDGANSIKSGAMAGVKDLALAILALTAADVIDGLTSWATGGSDVGKFAADLKPLGEGLAAFSIATDDVDMKNVEKAAKAALALTDVANKVPNEGGWLGKIMGENDIGSFGAKLEAFGTGLKKYSIAVAGLDPTGIEPSITAAEGLVELANKIPNEGGLWSVFAGENDLTTFGAHLTTFGEALVGYSSIVEGTVNSEAITNSVKGAEGLVELANNIPPEGGLWSLFSGNNNIDEFGTKLETFGKSLAAYSAAVAGKVDFESVDSSAKATKALIKMAKTLPEKDGMLSESMSLETFGLKLIAFGNSLSTYSTNINGVNFEKVTSSAIATKELSGAIKSMNGVKSENAREFTESINSLATANVSGFVTAFAGKADQLASAGEALGKGLASGIKSSKSSIIKIFTEIIDACRKTMTNKITEFTTAGEQLANSFSKGINKNASKATSAARKMAIKAGSATASCTVQFWSAGSNAAIGFANGIKFSSYRAQIAARAMANAAARAAEKALDEHSPSKVFYGIGDFAGAGFVNALLDYVSVARNTGAEMAKAAVSGTTKAISRIADAINSDVDSQPTIRPVVDLTEVTNGARAINSALSLNPSVAMATTVGTIMNRRNQNGPNSDVVSALKDLGKNMSKPTGNTYNINGVTYDDGSNVSRAVGDLIRAIKMEERS